MIKSQIKNPNTLKVTTNNFYKTCIYLFDVKDNQINFREKIVTNKYKDTYNLKTKTLEYNDISNSVRKEIKNKYPNKVISV